MVHGAPTTWIAPEWGNHLVIDNYYPAPSCSDFESTKSSIYAKNKQNKLAQSTEPFFSLKQVVENNHFKGIPKTNCTYLPLPQATKEVVIYTFDNPQGSDHVASSTHQSMLDQLMDSIVHRIRSEEYQCSLVTTRIQPKKENFFWGLFCGAPLSTFPRHVQLERFLDSLLSAMHKRALRLLHKYYRDLESLRNVVLVRKGIQQLVPEEMDNLESVGQFLHQDTRYRMLYKQVHWIKQLLRAREESYCLVKQTDATCFDSLESRIGRMKKLLEAVSWHRLMQSQQSFSEDSLKEEDSRQSQQSFSEEDSLKEEDMRHCSSCSSVSSSCCCETASTISTASTHASTHSRSLPKLVFGGRSLYIGGFDALKEYKKAKEAHLLNSREIDPPSQNKALQQILQVIQEEEFYEDYFELMLKDNWWSMAQADFENLAFPPDSRLSNALESICNEIMEKQDADVSFSLPSMSSESSSSSPTSSHTQRLQFFVKEIAECIREEFHIKNAKKSLQLFVERAVYPRIALLCFTEKASLELDEKDRKWRKQKRFMRRRSMREIGFSEEFLERLEETQIWGERHGQKVFFIASIDAFSTISSIVPCDLLKELMHGIVVIHNEAAQVVGTTQFSVETFFPILAYVLLHCELPHIHSILYLLENFAITQLNCNGEEAYYVYCAHAGNWQTEFLPLVLLYIDVYAL